MATRGSQPKQSTKQGSSPLAAEEWQLRILSELLEKQPRPTVKQRRQLAAQTGLDIKWITKWFKRVNSASKSKLQSTVGCPLYKSPTAAAAATKSIDGSSLNAVETADPTESGTSPSLFSAEKHALLFSGSGAVPESGRSAAAGLELEHPAVAPDAQANHEHHNPIFHPRSKGKNPAAVVPQQHLGLVERSQQTPLGIVTGPLYLASPFKDGTTSSALTQAGVDVTAQSVKSRGPHTSPSPEPLHTRYLYLNLISKALAPAYTTEYGHPQAHRGLAGHAVAEQSAVVRTNVVNLSVPDLATAQFGPSSAPLPSMYGLLFDTDRDSVDGLRADEGSRSSSRPLLGSDRMMMSPHVTVTVPVNPTPVSFLAKWEDMLALERRIRSSSCGAKLVQAKMAQAVEAHRTRQQGSRGQVTLTGTGTDRIPCGLDEQHFSPLSEIFEEPHKEDIPVSYTHSGVE